VGTSKDYLQKKYMELKRLEQEIMQAEKRGEEVPEGSLRVTEIQGKSRYFFRKPGEKKGRYLQAPEMELARNVAQKEYDRKLRKKILEQQAVIKHFIKNYDENALDNLYQKQCKGRKELILPRIQTNEEFIKSWYEANPGWLNPYDMKESYKTERGEFVRSKSEKILADMFYRMGVPYQYETALLLQGRTVYPDFLLLNVRRKESIYWEHFGKAGEEGYAVKNFQRMAEYERSGYRVGRNLLFSVECPGYPLDVKAVEETIHWWMDS